MLVEIMGWFFLVGLGSDRLRFDGGLFVGVLFFDDDSSFFLGDVREEELAVDV